MDKEFNIMIGQRIRQTRESRGFTQERLADRLDKTVQFVSSVERGISCPSTRTLAKICDALNVNADYILMGRKGDKIIPDYLYKVTELSAEQQALIEKQLVLLIDYMTNNPTN